VCNLKPVLPPHFGSDRPELTLEVLHLTAPVKKRPDRDDDLHRAAETQSLPFPACAMFEINH